MQGTMTIRRLLKIDLHKRMWLWDMPGKVVGGVAAKGRPEKVLAVLKKRGWTVQDDVRNKYGRYVDLTKRWRNQIARTRLQLNWTCFGNHLFQPPALYYDDVHGTSIYWPIDDRAAVDVESGGSNP